MPPQKNYFDVNAFEELSEGESATNPNPNPSLNPNPNPNPNQVRARGAPTAPSCAVASISCSTSEDIYGAECALRRGLGADLRAVL